MIAFIKSLLIFFSMTAESFAVQVTSSLITELKITYLINFFLTLPYLKKVPLNLIKGLLLIISLLFIHLIFVNSFNENLSTYLLSGFAQIIGITFMFFTSFMIIRNFNFEKLYHLNIFFIFFSLYAIYEYLMNYYIGNVNFRLNSYMKEPSHLIIICIFILLLNLYTQIKYKKTTIFFSLLLIILTESFTGYFIFLVILICLILKRKITLIQIFLIFLPIFALFILNFNTFLFNEIILRINDLFNFELKNLSISVLYVNSNVIIESFSIFGNGIGSHKHSFMENIHNINLSDSVLKDYIYLNHDDAASLFLRIVSDFGLISLLIFYFLFSKIRTFNYNLILVSYLIYAFIRMGHYFPPEAFFIILIGIKLEFYKTKSINV